MHERHPKTLACNLPALAEFGYLKDFPELLYRLIHGADTRKLYMAKAETQKIRRKVAEVRAARLAGKKRTHGQTVERSSESGDVVPAAAAPMETEEAAVENKSEAMDVAAAKEIPMTKEVRKVVKLAVQSLETYYGNGAYRFLFDCVAQFFADLLASDVEQLASGGRKTKIGRRCSARPSRAASSRATPAPTTLTCQRSTTPTECSTVSATRCLCRCGRSWSSRRCT